jgi:predicted ATPase/transcriptional regulator with XRE-family HTH domain
VGANDATASFGELLRNHRRASGLTQEELSEQAGVSPRSISELERGGAHIPRRDTVALLVRALRLEGADREAFEALVDRRRGPRSTLTKDPDQELAHLPVSHGPRSTDTPGERAWHNLPRALTSFVGRERELNELGHLLPTAPALTLVGPGGVGKTRLAQELVRGLVANYADGCWIVELAPLADPALIPGAVAAAVGLRDIHGRSVSGALVDYLKTKRLLLVLDNCEHLIAACAELVASLLRACPHLQVLATSREPLATEGEIVWRVPPLDLPDPRQLMAPEQITRTAAARLFVERARAVNHALVLTERSASAIARICVGVDGLPLALELAAARARVLTLEQIAERLEVDSRLLGGASRTGQARHQTIRATIDWSHDLLGEQEQILLRRLSVFAGGWSLDMAEVVCTGPGIEPTDVLDVLTQLVDKSLALADATNAVARYRLLEPIHQYALERLESCGEATTYRARHAAAFLELARTEAETAGPGEMHSLDRLEAEHDNLRVALRWAVVNHDSEAALRSSTALFRFWERRGHFQEGCTWLEQALDLAVDAPDGDRAPALNALANLCWRGVDAERALPVAEQALRVSRAAGSQADVAWALLNLGMVAYFQNQSDPALARLEESVLMARQADRPPLLSLALAYLGRALLWARGPLDQRAGVVLEESLGLATAAQSAYATGHALLTLGDLVWQLGDVERAIGLWRRSLVVRSRLTDRRGVAGCLERLALGLSASGQFDSAAWLFGAAEAQRQALGIGLRHDQTPDHDHLISVTRDHLSASFDSAWSAGQTASLDAAVGRALDPLRRLLAGSDLAIRSTP